MHRSLKTVLTMLSVRDKCNFICISISICGPKIVIVLKIVKFYFI